MNSLMYAILSILDGEASPLNSSALAAGLASRGLDVSERTVRYYLKRLDEEGFTTCGARRAREITDRGRQELRRHSVMNRVGFVVDRIHRLCLEADLDPHTGKGCVIVNVSLVPQDMTCRALGILERVLSSGFALSDRVGIIPSGERVGNIGVTEGLVAVCTVCSITINAVYLHAGIPARPRVGGIVDVVRHRPVRFNGFISYEHSSVAPLEIFIRSRMTRVLDTLATGDGSVLGSFREIPAEGMAKARDLDRMLQKMGFRSTSLYGTPFKTLLGMVVSEGMAGIVELGGLNPAAALAEAGLSVETHATAGVLDFSRLRSLHELYAPRRERVYASYGPVSAWVPT